MKRFLPLIFLVGACLLPLFFPSCANTTQAPSGGKRDTIPPLIIDIKPLPGAVRVPTDGATFVFTFNEYFTIKTAANIFLSPPQQRPPKSRVRGHDLIVTFEEPLEPNTTYTLSFTTFVRQRNSFSEPSGSFSKQNLSFFYLTIINCGTAS